MSTITRPQDLRRLSYLRWAGVALFTLIVLRVGYLKVVWADYYAGLADELSAGISRPLLPAPGAILDCSKRRIAYSERVFTVAVDPQKLQQSGLCEYAARALAAQLGIDYDATLRLTQLEGCTWRPIARHVTAPIATKVKKLGINGVSCEPTYMRKYPYKSIGCHLAGLRGADHTALDGPEKSYRFLIDGIPGTPRTNVDRFDRRIVGEEDAPVLPPVPGKSIVLAADMDIQQAADAALDDCMTINKPTTATCVVMDVRTGEIKALASRPNYDPNVVASGNPGEVASPSVGSRSIRPVVQPFEPGSTLKILTAAAALETGVADENTEFHCAGHETVGGRPMKCWGQYQYTGHGDLNLPQMLTKSCNLFAAHLAMKIGATKFFEFLANCGIGSPTYCGFPFDEPGILHPAASLRTRDLANMGFGQNLSVTDVQLLSACSAVVNDGILMQPHIVDQVLNPDGTVYRTVEPAALRRVCSADTSARIRRMLRMTVEQGTGRPARIPGIAVGGKTGTAQKWGRQDGVWAVTGYTMSFILFLPVDTVPRYAILVTAEDPKQGEHGADVAAPTARRVALEICKLTRMLSEAQVTAAKSSAAPG